MNSLFKRVSLVVIGTFLSSAAMADCSGQDLCLTSGISNSDQTIFYISRIELSNVPAKKNTSWMSPTGDGKQLSIQKGSNEVVATDSSGNTMVIGTVDTVVNSNKDMSAGQILHLSVDLTRGNPTTHISKICHKATGKEFNVVDSWYYEEYTQEALSFSNGSNSLVVQLSRYENMTAKTALFGCDPRDNQY